ncbi:DNA polymerase III, gamma and tau subunits [Campylobacter pinnipediorum subsp. caledonicus]|uniref:DNA polymerase III subunit gamma/tau n=1 Tax=Campylobacter pinnipediorum subsp. caledonicus TaxID=1874362 RepID=A0A1S6U7T5_9BACT|nr:DNA polymerase III subunit gamma/tau [Campylobacter pinnipediorum]AQW87806.1 DNA polymerase III, gamma and tau subunits [Campylobacter pinnipediorum subsp. caledonicus]
MQALALKYRPKNFSELIGQEAVSKSLTYALKDQRISHAYLFSGLRGSGKTSSARIFSKALVCEQGPTPTPCEECAHCKMANESRHMDIIEIDAASHRKIDDIRELIEQTKYNPASARYKIFIIDEVHMLTKEAFNALLKTLEEPPPYVKFILATTDPLKLPATILSRTQHFRFKQINKYAIQKHLEYILSNENISYEKEAIEILARSGSGSLRDTLTLLDQAIIYSNNKITQDSVVEMLGLLEPQRIEEIYNIVLSSDKNRLKELIMELESYEAEMIIDELITNLKGKFLNNDPRFSLLVYERFFRIFAQAKGMLNTTNDNNFVLSIMLFMMIEALNLQTIDEAISTQKQQTQQPIIQTQTIQEIKPENIKKEEKPKDVYTVFLEKIYYRDFDLGECLSKNTKFVSYENNVLSITSSASGNDQMLLRNSSKIIMQILKANFGEKATIKIVPTSKEAIKEDVEIQKVQDTKQEVEKNNNLSSLLDEELARLDVKEQVPIKIAQKSETKLSIQDEILSLNANKTKEELERNRQENLIREAKRLFGEPEISKIQ